MRSWIVCWTRPHSRKVESSINSDPCSPLSAARIRQRLANTRLPADPLKVVLPSELPRWPAPLQRKLTSNLKPAGVLIPIIERADQLSVLLTRRAANLKHHASQISFPGGRMEPGDADIEATALRETEEEVGIAPRQVEIAGYLEPSATVTGYAVTAVVGLLQSDFELIIDRSEVEAVFEVPLSFLMERGNQEHSERKFEGVMVPIVEFNYQQWRIWGATASILMVLRNKLIKDF